MQPLTARQYLVILMHEWRPRREIEKVSSRLLVESMIPSDVFRSPDTCHCPEMCTDHTIASQYASPDKGGFMGNQFLPLPNKYTLPSDQDGTDIDWDSIMLYTTDQNPPGVFKKPDGGKIVAKNVPSSRDCDGLKVLYGGGRQGTDTNFLSEPNNARNADFLKIACSE